MSIRFILLLPLVILCSCKENDQSSYKEDLAQISFNNNIILKKILKSDIIMSGERSDLLLMEAEKKIEESKLIISKMESHKDQILSKEEILAQQQALELLLKLRRTKNNQDKEFLKQEILDKLKKD